MQSVRRVVGFGTVALVLVAALAALWSRYDYKQWPWSSYPDPLHWCGRDYQPQGVQTRAEILRDGLHTFHEVGDLPGWLNRGEIWTTAASSKCEGPSAYWVKLDTDRYEAMVLEGGP